MEHESSTTTQNTDMTNSDEDNIPLVSAFDIPASQPAIHGHLATLQRLQAKLTELALKQREKQIQDLEFTHAIQESHKQNLLNSANIFHLPSAPPSSTNYYTRP